MTATAKKPPRERHEGVETLETEAQSQLFVKRMVIISLSSITYLRGIFPEDSYHSRYLGDMCIKILRQDCSCPRAAELITWLKGCFNGLDQKYLQIVLFGVHTGPQDTSHVIESYQFKFNYKTQQAQLSGEDKVTMEETKKASEFLIQKLSLLMQNLDALPASVYLSIKLYYNDNVTPPEYEPPGFQAGVNDSMWFEGKAVHFRVGDLQTSFHTMKLRVTVAQSRLGKLQDAGQPVRRRDTDPLSVPPLKRPVTQSTNVRSRGVCEEDVLSQNDSLAQFKLTKKTTVKRKFASNKLARQKKKCF